MNNEQLTISGLYDIFFIFVSKGGFFNEHFLFCFLLCYKKVSKQHFMLYNMFLGVFDSGKSRNFGQKFINLIIF